MSDWNAPLPPPLNRNNPRRLMGPKVPNPRNLYSQQDVQPRQHARYQPYSLNDRLASSSSAGNLSAGSQSHASRFGSSSSRQTNRRPVLTKKKINGHPYCYADDLEVTGPEWKRLKAIENGELSSDGDEEMDDEELALGMIMDDATDLVPPTVAQIEVIPRHLSREPASSSTSQRPPQPASPSSARRNHCGSPSPGHSDSASSTLSRRRLSPPLQFHEHHQHHQLQRLPLPPRSTFAPGDSPSLSHQPNSYPRHSSPPPPSISSSHLRPSSRHAEQSRSGFQSSEAKPKIYRREPAQEEKRDWRAEEQRRAASSGAGWPRIGRRDEAEQDAMSRQSTEQNGRRGMPMKDNRANKDNDELVVHLPWTSLSFPPVQNQAIHQSSHQFISPDTFRSPRLAHQLAQAPAQKVKPASTGQVEPLFAPRSRSPTLLADVDEKKPLTDAPSDTVVDSYFTATYTDRARSATLLSDSELNDQEDVKPLIKQEKTEFKLETKVPKLDVKPDIKTSVKTEVKEEKPDIIKSEPGLEPESILPSPSPPSLPPGVRRGRSAAPTPDLDPDPVTLAGSLDMHRRLPFRSAPAHPSALPPAPPSQVSQPFQPSQLLLPPKPDRLSESTPSFLQIQPSRPSQLAFQTRPGRTTTSSTSMSSAGTSKATFSLSSSNPSRSQPPFPASSSASNRQLVRPVTRSRAAAVNQPAPPDPVLQAQLRKLWAKCKADEAKRKGAGVNVACSSK